MSRDYTSAAHTQARARLEADYRAGHRLIQPSRITMALDVRDLHGPEVDEACDAREPDVDHWEAGTAVPTWEQVEKLAALTDMPVSFFFVEPSEHDRGPVWMCGPRQCERIEPSEPVAPYDPAAPLARIYRLKDGRR